MRLEDYDCAQIHVKFEGILGYMSLPKKGMLTIFSRVNLKGMKVSFFFLQLTCNFAISKRNTHGGGRETEKEIDTEGVREQEQEGKDYEILGTLRLMMVQGSFCQGWFLEFENSSLIEESRLWILLLQNFTEVTTWMDFMCFQCHAELRREEY